MKHKVLNGTNAPDEAALHETWKRSKIWKRCIEHFIVAEGSGVGFRQIIYEAWGGAAGEQYILA